MRLEDRERLLSQAECAAIVQRIRRFAKVPDLIVSIASWWQGEVRWGRNRVMLGSDRRDVQVTIQTMERQVMSQGVTTNQLDDVSLEDAVRAIERLADFVPSSMAAALYPSPSNSEAPSREASRRSTPPAAAIWSDATYNLATPARGEVARALIEPAESQGMLSAGYLELRAGARAAACIAPEEKYRVLDTPYAAWTQAQCSMTVRDPAGTGSGWAGFSSYDWATFDSAALGERALQKCLASQHPVALEPGRYTVILEPQAVCDLMEILLWPTGPSGNPLNRMSWTSPRGAEGGGGPFALAFDDALSIWRTKLGLKVADERITIGHDPADPALGIVPDPSFDMAPVTWIDRGVLTNLGYTREYVLGLLPRNGGVRFPTGYRMSGGETAIDEMIASTKRGLLVTRLSKINVLQPQTLLASGLTRDGLWLIENGKISKAVKNLRFTESPLFVLNSLDQLGPPVPVFRPVTNPYSATGLTPAIVPPLKVRDFSFTSVIDAI